MKNKPSNIIIMMLISVILLPVSLCGCNISQQTEKSDEPAPAIEFVGPAETAEAPEPESKAKTENNAEPENDPGATGQPESDTEPKPETGKQDGERFEATIMLEGMEEQVRYEHVKNLEIGFEMDYEYESLARKKESDGESFVSIYDDQENPQNYLKITYMEKVVDNAVSSVEEELSGNYDTVTEQGAFDNAGSCTKVATTGAKSGAKTPDLLQTVYILPAGDGSIVAEAHYTTESAEGFGSRFDQMMDTLTVIGRTAESNLSNEQALEAIKKYCFANNPDLEDMSGSDDYTIYWDVSTDETGEVVVLYRSYTGAQIRYHVDPDSGQTYVTELVPGITDEEQRTDESFNVRDYMDQ